MQIELTLLNGECLYCSMCNFQMTKIEEGQTAYLIPLKAYTEGEPVVIDQVICGKCAGKEEETIENAGQRDDKES